MTQFSSSPGTINPGADYTGFGQASYRPTDSGTRVYDDLETNLNLAPPHTHQVVNVPAAEYDKKTTSETGLILVDE